MRCDLDCPFECIVNYCCRGCRRHEKHLKDKFPDKWVDKFGFWSPAGCRIGEDRSKFCKGYDCKEQLFFAKRAYVDGRWITTALHEVSIKKHDKAFVDRYNELFREYK